MKTRVHVRTPQGEEELMVKIDTGADVSCANSELAKQHGWKLQDVPPVTAVGGTTATPVVLDKASDQLVRLSEDAPMKNIRFFVHEKVLEGNASYALVGVADLVDFTLSLGPERLVLEYHGVGQEQEAEVMREIEIDTFSEKPPVLLGEQLKGDQRKDVEQLLDSYSEVFQPLDEEPAHLEPFEVRVKEDAVPRVQPCRWLNKAKLQAAQEFFDREVAHGRYEQIFAPVKWASPITMVTKASGGWRVCGDYTLVNSMSEIPPSQIPDQRDILDFTNGRKFFAKLDWTAGYNQIPNTPATANLLTVTTPMGLYRPMRMPFGPSAAPAHFQTVVRKIVERVSDARAFFDDIPVASKTFEDFVGALRRIFERAREFHIRFNPKKCVIGVAELPLLGRIVTESGVATDPERLQALRDMQAPRDKKELASFIGLTGWFSQFIPHMSSLQHPFRDLLRANHIWEWTQAHQKAFETLRVLILEAPTLTHRVQGRDVSLRSDASDHGIAAVFFQRNPETDAWELLAAFSRALNKAEKNYSTIEKEALAIVWGVNRARGLWLDRLLIITDHSNLKFLHTSANSRVQRWSVILSEFDYTVVWAPGRDNSVSDFLSRALKAGEVGAAPVVELHPVDTDTLEVDDLVTLGIPKGTGDKTLELPEPPPKEVIAKIWSLGHGNPWLGHLGRQRSIRRILASVTWPGAATHLEKLATECPTCQKLRAKRRTPNDLATTAAEYPYESVFMDFIGPLTKMNGYEYILVMLDRFSHEVILEATQSTAAQETATIIADRWIAQAGIPRLITTDGGPPFTSAVIADLLKELETKHHVSAPYHPEGHGAVERANRDVEQVLRGSMRTHEEWPSLLKPTQFALNTAYSRALGTSPFEVVHGFAPHFPLDAALRTGKSSDLEPASFGRDTAKKFLKIVKEVRSKHAKIHEEHLKQASKQKKNLQFTTGDYVLIQFPRKGKLEIDWKGPYVIVGEDEEAYNVFHCRSLVDEVVERIHLSRLHPFISGDLTPPQISAEATPDKEYLIEKVLDHVVMPSKELRFYVVWLGFKNQGRDSADQWVSLPNCHCSPAVKKYIKDNHLEKAVKERKKALGPLPRT